MQSAWNSYLDGKLPLSHDGVAGLKPGTNVRFIRMRFSGAGKIHTDPSGSLRLGNPAESTNGY